jgi:hypothetical protein
VKLAVKQYTPQEFKEHGLISLERETNVPHEISEGIYVSNLMAKQARFVSYMLKQKLLSRR